MRSRVLLRLLAGVAAWLVAAAALAEPGVTRLSGGWGLQSSARVQEGGTAVSTPGFDAAAWHPTSVPATVMAALVANKVHPDPYFGSNLRRIPGAPPPGENFSNLPMPADSPFRVAWWYRKEFDAPAAAPGSVSWLRFDGINYRANIWLNGQLLAGEKEVVGAFRRYEFDVTRLLRPGKANAVAVQVFAPGPKDLAITWVDWNPAPPDKNMGLWGGVSLAITGPVAIRHPYVVTKLDAPSLDKARLTVIAEVRNAGDAAVEGTLRGSIGNVRFSQGFALGPREGKSVVFAPDRFPQLEVKEPRLWWPYRLGKPELHELRVEAEVAGAASDSASAAFGIHEVTSELTPDGRRLFKVNGRPILVRGGGWASDMMLRASEERLEAEFRYVKEMGLNTIRLEGKLEDEAFFERADREGILIMAGWCCCDHWEKWEEWKGDERRVAVASLEDQILRLRNHPSVLVWLNGSDSPPPADIEKAYLDVLGKCRWAKPTLSSATQKPAASGPSGVKMTGPYDYVPPSYWLEDKKHGGAFGFNTETSPGAAVPPIESLRQMLPPEHLWPIDDVWLQHAGGGEFRNLKLFTGALEARYGKARGVEDYARKAQALAYEGERAMFEAFGRNKYAATGVIQWMLNNAWPSMIWHLYDYYLRPGGGYYGAKKACEPVHVQYSHDDRSVVVVNDTPRGHEGLKVTAKVYDMGLGERFAKEGVVSVAADGVARVFDVPAIPGLTTAYFLRLALEDAHGQTLSRNFYWLSTRLDQLEWNKSEWYYTPTRVHADLTALETLPQAALRLTASFEDGGPEGKARVRVDNTSPHLAFQVRLKLSDSATGQEILPVYWEDNYLEVMPGETREIGVAYPLQGRMTYPALTAEGWNVAPTAP